MKVGLLILTLMAAVQYGAAEPGQVIIIRHGEKPDDPNAVHLSKAGEKRARELVPFLTTNPELTKHGLPVALFATKTTKSGHGQRTQETIAPLANKLHQPVSTEYHSEDYQALAQSILSNPKFQGKTVLVCWTHEFIPQLTAALGVHPQPPKWKDEVYDRVYLITYHQGRASLKDLPQLLSGDVAEPKVKKHKT